MAKLSYVFGNRVEEDFVMHARKNPIRVKSGERTYLTNSERTLTSRNLSNTSLHQPERDTNTLKRLSTNGDKIDSEKKKPLGHNEFDLDLKSLSSSLNKSVSFNSHLPKRNDGSSDDSDEDGLQDTFEEELQKLIEKDSQENEEQTIDRNLVGRPQLSSSQWFTEPIHLNKSSEYPAFESLGLDVQKTSLANRTVGTLGTVLAQQKVSSEILLDDLAKEYFPVTLGTMRSIARTITPPPPYSGLSSHRPPSVQSEPWNVSYAMKSRPQSSMPGMSVTDPITSAIRDYNYLQVSQPFVDQTVVASPHQYELAKLRMERLRLEEQRILETKRQEELERIRGPKPKWYEMKTQDFTYEHYKHNKLLQSRDRWQELLDYRNNLRRSSKEFSKGHTSMTSGSSPLTAGSCSRSSTRASNRFTNSDSSSLL